MHGAAHLIRRTMRVMRIVVTGGTGFVGQGLVPNLQGRNHGIVVASRDPDGARARLPPGVATCGLSGESLQQSLRGAGAVVNLAGDPIAQGRWDDEKKLRIRSSRVEVTQRLVEEIAAVPAQERPRVLVSASAVGWYGDTGDEARDESAAAGADFLAQVCRDWERAALQAEPHGVRVVVLRLGLVLARGGGVLEALERPFRMFAGAPLGPGTNWQSWIHRGDLASLVGFALERDLLRGAVNAVTPEPVRHLTLCRALARRLHRPCWPGIPRPIVRLLFGEEKARTLLMSQRVVPRVAQSQGFAWRLPSLDAALAEEYG